MPVLPVSRGALPPWLPAKVWEGFQGDDLVMALDGSVLQEGWKLWKKVWSAEYPTYLPLAPLCAGSEIYPCRRWIWRSCASPCGRHGPG